MKTITFFVAVVFSATMSAQCFDKIVGGNSYHLAISQDGSLWGWGENSNSQLGDGTIVDKASPVLINSGNWQYVAAGTTHSLGIKSDGTLWAWGSDSGGKLGNGASGNSVSPMQIGTATNWKEVHAGEVASIGIKTDGTLWAWGWNTNYYLGNGQATNFISQTPIQIGTDSNWSTMTAKGWSCLAIKTNGQLWGWGENSLGQLGKGDNIDAQTPVQIGTANTWLKVTSNERLSFGIKDDHTLWAWGTQTNNFSHLGINGVFSPLQIGTATDWQTVSVKPVPFNDFVLLTKSNGTLWAWGNDDFEQLGNSTSSTHFDNPSQVGSDSNWVAAVAGTNLSTAVKTNGSFWAWGATTLVGSGSGNIATPTQYACTSLSTAENAVSKLRYYPNPVRDLLFIEGIKDILSATVFDLSGRICTADFSGNRLQVSHLSAGVYLLHIETGNSHLKVKFIKQ